MKKIIYLLLVFTPFFMNAQQTTKKVEAPKIITKLKVGTSINLETKSIRFLKVTEDSRCPTGVSCVWAGQAKVVIGVYENDALIEEKQIIVGANGFTPDKNKELLTSGEKTILGYNLAPYPSSGRKINSADYYLELLVK